ncbi:amidase family protein [Halomonas alkalicola]|uniref:Amidase family protein n=1 Tax=Halomonas alkalicola TaxID=1930622 RepID=A0ABY9H4B7_9GAMM|nr:amidase family protein [Halomonas alkalicola]WLI73238.1 amidase family protein [Halomonas alkalicola]
MAYEAARTLAGEYRHFADRMGPKLVELLEAGRALPFVRYREARAQASALQPVLSRVFAEEVDVILAASAQGVAPKGLDATGDPLYCRAWTLLGVPCLNLPLCRGEAGMPLGVQLVGDRFGDERLLAIAQTLVEASPSGVAPVGRSGVTGQRARAGP